MVRPASPGGTRRVCDALPRIGRWWRWLRRRRPGRPGHHPHAPAQRLVHRRQWPDWWARGRAQAVDRHSRPHRMDSPGWRAPVASGGAGGGGQGGRGGIGVTDDFGLFTATSAVARAARAAPVVAAAAAAPVARLAVPRSAPCVSNSSLVASDSKLIGGAGGVGRYRRQRRERWWRIERLGGGGDRRLLRPPVPARASSAATVVRADAAVGAVVRPGGPSSGVYQSGNTPPATRPGRHQRSLRPRLPSVVSRASRASPRRVSEDQLR